MSNIQTSAPALLGKSTGSTLAEIAVVRNGTAQRGSTRQTIAAPAENTANALHNLQTQIDQIKQALTAPLPALTSFQVVDASGAQIAWIGTQTVGDQVFVGAWFKEIFIGGTSAANAVISTDGSGNVFITGAEIDLTANGIETIINNATNPWSLHGSSLTSIDVATGNYSEIDPFNISILTAANAAVIYMRNAVVGSNHFGLLAVGNDLDNHQVSLSGTQGSVACYDGTNTSYLAPTALQVTGNANANSYSVSGAAGLNLTIQIPTTINPASVTAITGVSFSTAANAVFGTPGTGQSNGNVVTAASVSMTASVLGTATTLHYAPNTWSEGILTA